MKRWQKITGAVVLAILILYELLIWANAALDLKYIFTPYGIHEIDDCIIERAHLRINGLSAVMWLNMALVVVLFCWLWRKDKREQNGGATFRQQLLLSAGRALWGEISPNVRAVAVGCNDKSLHLIYYLDSPTEENYESVHNVAGEIMADFPSGTFVSSKEECIESAEPIKELDALDGWVYIRKEGNAIPSGNIEFPFAFEKTCCRSGVFTDDSEIERMEAYFVRHDKMAIRYKNGLFGPVVIDDAKSGKYDSYEMSTGTIIGIRATEGLANHIARLSDGRLLVFAVHPRGYGELYENFGFLAPSDDGYADYLAEYEQGTDIR